MIRSRAVVDGDRVSYADSGRELTLEGGDLRTLCELTRTKYPRNRRDFFFADMRNNEWY